MSKEFKHKFPMNAVCRNCWYEYGDHCLLDCQTDEGTEFKDSGLRKLDKPHERTYEAILVSQKKAEELAWEFTGAYPKTEWQYDIDETTEGKFRLQVYPK